MTDKEIETASWVEDENGFRVTEYQFRSLAVIKDSFHTYRWKKYPHETCVWDIDEFKPMFCEIHRAITYFVENRKLSVHDALIAYLKAQ